jgi:hypothetical protein
MYRKACLFSAALAAAAVVTGAAAPARAAVSPVFDYNFPASSSNLSTGTVTDLSTAGHNAAAVQFSGTGLSTDVPAGMSGDSAVFSTAANTLIKTQTASLLNNTAIAANGGFTEDVWVKPTATPGTGNLYKLIDYAGTDYLAFDDSDHFVFEFNGVPATETLSGAASLSAWHHVIVTFDTTGNSVTSGTLTGLLTLTVDGVSTTPVSETKSTFGDSLNRAIGIGGHPVSGEIFTGEIYNPQVELGVAAVPEPATLSVLGMGAIALLSRRRRKQAAK